MLFIKQLNHVIIPIFDLCSTVKELGVLSNVKEKMMFLGSIIILLFFTSSSIAKSYDGRLNLVIGLYPSANFSFKQDEHKLIVIKKVYMFGDRQTERWIRSDIAFFRSLSQSPKSNVAILPSACNLYILG